MNTRGGQTRYGGEHAADEEPKLSREIAKTAWLVLKVLLGIAIPFTLFFFVAKTHPLLAIGLLQGLVMAAMIGFFGYQNYKWKKSDWEYKKTHAADDEKWAEARARLRRDARG
jgi:hypothetical protein